MHVLDIFHPMFCDPTKPAEFVVIPANTTPVTEIQLFAFHAVRMTKVHQEYQVVPGLRSGWQALWALNWMSSCFFRLLGDLRNAPHSTQLQLRTTLFFFWERSLRFIKQRHAPRKQQLNLSTAPWTLTFSVMDCARFLRFDCPIVMSGIVTAAASRLNPPVQLNQRFFCSLCNCLYCDFSSEDPQTLLREVPPLVLFSKFDAEKPQNSTLNR